jgi:hypothetical protein
MQSVTIITNVVFSYIMVGNFLVEETGRSGENHQPVASHWQLYHIMVYTSPWSRFEITTLVMIVTDCIGSCKSNYHTITPRWHLLIKLGLSFMVPDCVYKFQIICLQGTYVSYRQDNKKPKLSNVWYIGLDLDQKKWWTRQMVQMQIWLSFMTVSPGFRGARH